MLFLHDRRMFPARSRLLNTMKKQAAKTARKKTTKTGPEKLKPSTKSPLTSFAVRLRKAREDAGVTQAALGDATGFGKRSIARYEAGGALPSIQGAAAIARILGVSLDRLGGMDTDQDPELARMLAQVAGLSESDRLVAKRVLELLAEKNARK